MIHKQYQTFLINNIFFKIKTNNESIENIKVYKYLLNLFIFIPPQTI